MSDRTKRLGLAIVFAGLLVSPLWLRTPPAPAAPGSHHGLSFLEVAEASGLIHRHEGPTLDGRLSHIQPLVAAFGAAVSVSDFDRDGFADLYVTNSREGSHNRLFRNQGDGRFVDVAADVGLADANLPGAGVSMGSVWGDFDNDGFEDLFVYRWGRQDLYRNEGGRRFTPVATGAWPAWANINSAVWLDFDADGLLDLFLGGYFDERVNLWSLTTTRIMPESFEYATNGGRKYLYRNLGDGRFAEVSERVGLNSRRWALAAVAADPRGTGYPDLFIANDYGVSEYFRNDRGTFTEVGRETGVGLAPKSGMNASLADVFNDGRQAIYVSNISEDGILLQGNNLWMPAGPQTSGGRFENMAGALGVELGGWSFGAQFGDLNNDGWLDLFMVNGYISADPSRSYWYDYSKVAGGHEVIIGDAANWPALDGRSLAGYQQSRVWLNQQGSGFVDAASAVGVTEREDGRAVALADLDNRGALDVVVANQLGPLRLYRNSVDSGRRWIAFDLEGACRPTPAPAVRCTNRSAIGAQVTVHWQGRRQTRFVDGGSGFSSQNDRRLHFGLGDGDAGVDRVEVRWPSGQVTALERPAVGRRHVIREGA